VCSRTISSCGVSQIDSTSRTGVSASAPSIAQPRPRAVGARIAAAASAAAITIPAARTASGPTAVSTSTAFA
jgi:hypothetical protein